MGLQGKDYRNSLLGTKRIVVKVGTRVLVTRSGKPDRKQIEALAQDIASLQHSGKEVILVSSGAIAAGIEALGLKTRPRALPELQMAAAVGQVRLMSYYDEFFSSRKIQVAQVLLTHDDLRNRMRHLNARNTMNRLLSRGILPVVNENDVVSVDDIKLGDNDILASLVTLLVDADALVLLTSADGLRAPTANGRTKRIRYLSGVSEADYSLVTKSNDSFSTGGMKTKLQAAQTALSAGAVAIIAPGRKKGVLADIFDAKDVGTFIEADKKRASLSLPVRKRWIAFFHRAEGTIFVDKGASDAIVKKGKSLLPIGIKDIDGKFPFGSMVNLKTMDGTLLARGLVGYSSEQIAQIKGKKTADLARVLGEVDYDEVIHRDNMVLLLSPPSR